MINLYNSEDDSFETLISICIWGEWLGGRIGENAYKLVHKEMNSDKNTLILEFSENERCTIYKPHNVKWEGKLLTIESAEKIVWEFYYYGEPQTPETYCRTEYRYIDDKHVRVIEKSAWSNRYEIINPSNKLAIDTY